MRKIKNLNSFEAVAIIMGGIIGAGILGIPFAFAQGGFYISLAILLLVGSALLVLRLMLGEVILRTPGDHQLVGYAELYLGKFFKYFLSLIIIVEIYGAMLAYTIGQGQVLSDLFGGSVMVWTLGAYFVLAGAVVAGLRLIKSLELIMVLVILAAVIAIIFLARGSMDVAQIPLFEIGDLFMVYGVALFACAGLVMIPEAKEILSETADKLKLRRTIVLGSLVPIALYLIFTIVVLSVTGIETTSVATIGLGNTLGASVLVVASIFALFAMATSFLALGLALYQVYRYDYRLPKKFASFLTVIVPISLFLLGARNFIEVISFIGTLGVGFAGLMVMMMFWKAKRLSPRAPEYHLPLWLVYPATVILTLMLAGGIVYLFAR